MRREDLQYHYSIKLRLLLIGYYIVTTMYRHCNNNLLFLKNLWIEDDFDGIKTLYITEVYFYPKVKILLIYMFFTLAIVVEIFDAFSCSPNCPREAATE